jgi:hypothetical protein
MIALVLGGLAVIVVAIVIFLVRRLHESDVRSDGPSSTDHVSHLDETTLMTMVENMTFCETGVTYLPSHFGFQADESVL